MERWKPKYRELYYSVNLEGVEKVDVHLWTNHEWDNRNWERYNCFKNREEALEEANAIIALLGMRAGMKNYNKDK